MPLRLALAFVLLAACETPPRPTPRDTGLDAPVDAPPPLDVGACVEVAGYYVGTSTCPALGGAAFPVCLSRTECTATVYLASSAMGTEITFAEDRGTFSSPTLATDVTCTDATVDGDQLTFECRDRAGIACRVMLQRRTTDAEGLCCLSSSTCSADAACTLVAIGAGPPVTTACVERTGTVAEGAACTRGASGADDCASGLYCTGLVALTCRTLCRSDAECDGTEVCIAPGTVPALGFCAASCDVFAPGACGAGLGCQPVATHPEVARTRLGGSCARVGTAALDAPCELEGCVDGLVCARNALLELRCATPCDAGHPCAAGSCVPLAEGDALGFCG